MGRAKVGGRPFSAAVKTSDGVGRAREEALGRLAAQQADAAVLRPRAVRDAVRLQPLVVQPLEAAHEALPGEALRIRRSQNGEDADSSPGERRVHLDLAAGVVGALVRREGRRRSGDHDGDFSPQVEPRIVGIAQRGRIHAEAGENQRGRDLRVGRGEAAAGQEIVLAVFQLGPLAVPEQREGGVGLAEGDAEKGHGLEVGAAGPRRREPQRLETRRHVLRGEIVAARSGPPAFQKIVRQEPHVGADGRGPDLCQRPLHVPWRLLRRPRRNSGEHSESTGGGHEAPGGHHEAFSPERSAGPRTRCLVKSAARSLRAGSSSRRNPQELRLTAPGAGSGDSR